MASSTSITKRIPTACTCSHGSSDGGNAGSRYVKNGKLRWSWPMMAMPNSVWERLLVDGMVKRSTQALKKSQTSTSAEKKRMLASMLQAVLFVDEAWRAPAAGVCSEGRGRTSGHLAGHTRPRQYTYCMDAFTTQCFLSPALNVSPSFSLLLPHTNPFFSISSSRLASAPPCAAPSTFPLSFRQLAQ